MDSRKKDEWNDRRREEALARRMGEALDRIATSEAGGCPDAGVIAAYHEQALDAEEFGRWENHFAGCSRCRKILAVLAASVEVPLADDEVARLGQLVASSAGRTPQAAPEEKVKQIRPGRWDWRARWLAPALGVAAVLAVWFAMRPPWRAPGTEPSGTLIAQAPRNEAPLNPPPSVSDELSKAAPQPNQNVVVLPPAGRSATSLLNSPAATPLEPRAASGNSMQQVSPDVRVETGPVPSEKKLDGRSNGVLAPAPMVPPPAPAASAAVPAAPSLQAQADTSAGGERAARDMLAPVPPRAAGGAIAPEAAPQAALRARNTQNFAAMKSAAEPPAMAKAPSGSNAWRAGKGGRIERSTDSGRTWTPQASPSQEDWLAVAAVSDTAGWLAGRNGAIARTTDGEHWERVAPPAAASDSAGKFVDWIGITAGDAQTATVTGRDGRRFTTQDGGKSWRAEK